MRVIVAGGAWMVSFQPVSYGVGGIGRPLKNGVGSTTIGRLTGMWPLMRCHCCT